MQLAINDPVYVPKSQHNAFERFVLRFINDPRDLPFIYLCLKICLITVPMAAFLYWPGMFRWWMAPIYLAVNLGVFMGPLILMLHNTSHRRLFKHKYKALNNFIPWCMGPFFGETPESYFAHHIGMHHAENNLEPDLSSTMRYDRSRFDHFMLYFLRFFFAGIPELSVYLVRKNRAQLMRRFLMGEFAFYLLVAGLMFVNWQATLVVFVFPFCFTRFMMMAGNWAQHAFIDPTAPGNAYRNSITCINTPYNKQCFNDGYHIGHHVRPMLHWTDMPGDFQKNIAKYRAEGSVVFQKIDYFMIWFYLMLGRFDWLAKHYVDLNPDQPMTREQIMAHLRARTRPVAAVH